MAANSFEEAESLSHISRGQRPRNGVPQFSIRPVRAGQFLLVSNLLSSHVPSGETFGVWVLADSLEFGVRGFGGFTRVNRDGRWRCHS
jgi:hypothetical protein